MKIGRFHNVLVHGAAGWEPWFGIIGKLTPADQFIKSGLITIAKEEGDRDLATEIAQFQLGDLAFMV